MFWNIARFINQSLVCLFQAQADYTCSKDSLPKMLQEFYIKSTLFLSSKFFSVLVVIFFWLVAIKEKKVSFRVYKAFSFFLIS